MAIIETHGGPITHRYLIGKTKGELANMYMHLLRETEQDARDAERYRWLRERSWSSDELCVVASPKQAVKLGHDCPSRNRLDEAIDTAMKSANT